MTEMTERGRGKENVSSSNNSESIQVVVRLRPENEKDKNRYGKHCVSLTSEKSISLFRPLNSKWNQINTSKSLRDATANNNTYDGLQKLRACL